MLKFDKFSYTNKIFKATNALECELHYTDIELDYVKSLYNFRKNSVEMDMTKVVLIDINKIKDLLSGKTFVTNLEINGVVEISNIETEKLVVIKKKTNILKEKNKQSQKSNSNDKKPENRKEGKKLNNFRKNIKNERKTKKILMERYKHSNCITRIVVSVIFLSVLLCILICVFVAYRRKRNKSVTHYTTINSMILYTKV